MLDLSEFKKSRLYESVLIKIKLELVQKLLAKGLSVQEIADLLELDVEEVKKVARE
jgi:predicted transposase YdaD